MIDEVLLNECKCGVNCECEETHKPSARLCRHREAYQEMEYGREQNNGNEFI